MTMMLTRRRVFSNVVIASGIGFLGIPRSSAATNQLDAAIAPKMKPIMANRLIAGGNERRCGTVASPMIRAAEVFSVSCSSVSRERLRKD